MKTKVTRDEIKIATAKILFGKTLVEQYAELMQGIYGVDRTELTEWLRPRLIFSDDGRTMEMSDEDYTMFVLKWL